MIIHRLTTFTHRHTHIHGHGEGNLIGLIRGQGNHRARVAGCTVASVKQLMSYKLYNLLPHSGIPKFIVCEADGGGRRAGAVVVMVAEELGRRWRKNWADGGGDGRAGIDGCAENFLLEITLETVDT